MKLTSDKKDCPEEHPRHDKKIKRNVAIHKRHRGDPPKNVDVHQRANRNKNGSEHNPFKCAARLSTQSIDPYHYPASGEIEKLALFSKTEKVIFFSDVSYSSIVSYFSE
jgi:hypothetical protein